MNHHDPIEFCAAELEGDACAFIAEGNPLLIPRSDEPAKPFTGAYTQSMLEAGLVEERAAWQAQHIAKPWERPK